MAVGWAGDDAVSEQIESSIDDAVQRARRQLPRGESALLCADCEEPIPERRREAMPGVRFCAPCQNERDKEAKRAASLYNRRGSKDSQLR
ncbi:MAG: DksA/TraR family C4-type zinc finger protein [Myxococcota bacterium]|jgi:phage/conjugal plasmid C-4 type zinc finger TraR family protein|nr:DksA/TraR family C4-type zinc finger protein [Myxococcota bacterium]